MSEPHTIPPHEPLSSENDPTGRWRIAELEAEVARLKRQQCGTCANQSEALFFDVCEAGVTVVVDDDTEPPPSDFSCNRWTARAEEGSEK